MAITPITQKSEPENISTSAHLIGTQADSDGKEKVYRMPVDKLGKVHTHALAGITKEDVDLTAYGAVLQTSGSAKDYYRFEPTESFGDEATPTPEYSYTVFTASDLPLSAKIELIGSDYDGKDCIVVNGAEYKYDPVTQTEPFVLYETITEPIKIKTNAGDTYLKITKYTGQSGFISAMEKAEIAETAAKAESLEKSKANAKNSNGGFNAGQNSASLAGVAIGQNAATKNGVAIGKDANSEHCRDAVQIGAGENKENGTVKFYDHKLMNADGSIPAERYVHEHALAGLVETDVDLTTCSSGNGTTISEIITSNSLAASVGTITVTLDADKTYVVKGTTDSHGLQLKVDGVMIAEATPDSTNVPFEYSGKIGVMTANFPGSGSVTFETFKEITSRDGFMTSADKSKLNGLPNEVYNKTEIDEKLVLSGTNEEDVDLTTCAVTDGNGYVTSKQLSGSADTFTITLEKGTEYKFKGNLEGAGLSITVNGEILTTTGDDVSSTSTFEYSGTVDSMTVYIPGGYCTFDNFIAVKRVNGFMTSADKAKLDGLPNDAYSKSETDSKIDLLSLKAEKSGEALRISDACELEQTADVSIASKNLIPVLSPLTTKTHNGVTYTVGTDGSIMANGTVGSNATFSYFFASVSFPMVTGKYYTLSGCPQNSLGGKASLSIGNPRNGNVIDGSFDNGSGVTFKLTTELTGGYVCVIMIRGIGTTVENLVFKPQLELGTSATAYTPHVSDISSASVKKYGKNLIPYPYTDTTKTVNGVTFTDNGDASVTVSGTPTEYADFILATVSVKPGQTYTLLKNQTGANNVGFVISEYNNQSVQKHHTSDSPQNTFTFTTSESTYHLIIRIKRTANSAACTGTFKPMLELGNAATDYEPYKAPVTYTPDSDGKVSGVTLGSDTATLTTDTSGVIINAKYKKDITKAFEELETKLTNAILSNGGNV